MFGSEDFLREKDIELLILPAYITGTEIKLSQVTSVGGLCRCNYCENGPVLDSNEYTLKKWG